MTVSRDVVDLLKRMAVNGGGVSLSHKVVTEIVALLNQNKYDLERKTEELKKAQQRYSLSQSMVEVLRGGDL